MGKQRRKRWGKRQVKHILWQLWWWWREGVRGEINMHPAKAQLFKYVVVVVVVRLFVSFVFAVPGVRLIRSPRRAHYN